jgi:hypothetical protein
MYLIAWTATSFPVISKDLDKSLDSDSVAISSFAAAQRGKHNSHYNLISFKWAALILRAWKT